MIIKCTYCHTAFKIEDKLIKEKGTSFRCSRCKQIFHVFPPDSAVHKNRQASNQTSEVSNNICLLLDNFENALKQVLTSTQQLVNEYENQSKPESKKKTTKHHVSKSDISELLLRLDGLLKNNDLEAEDSLNLLKAQLGNSEIQNDLSILETHIDQLEFEDARKTLKRIAQALNIS